MTPLYFVYFKFILHRIWPSWLLSKDMIWGKPFYFVHLKFTLLCMSVLTLEQILIWVLVFVLVLDMKVLDLLKYFLKKWVLDQYLYLVYIWGTWCTWVLGQLYLTPTLDSIRPSPHSSQTWIWSRLFHISVEHRYPEGTAAVVDEARPLTHLIPPALVDVVVLLTAILCPTISSH